MHRCADKDQALRANTHCNVTFHPLPLEQKGVDAVIIPSDQNGQENLEVLSDGVSKSG